MASVLLMAGSAKTSLTGFLLIGVYIVGFTPPFLAVGIFTGSALEFFRKHGKVMQYTVKAGLDTDDPDGSYDIYRVDEWSDRIFVFYFQYSAEYRATERGF